MAPKAGFDTATLQAKDNRWIHPWEALSGLGQQERTVITGGTGIHVHDSDGKRMIDGPAGMWCVNIGHGRREMADAIAEQAARLGFFSPWSLTNAPAAELAQKLTDIAPEGFNHVFFATGGSTAVDSALRLAMFVNATSGRPERKHIISRRDAYHGSTYLTASCSGKRADRDMMTLEKGFVHLLSSPNPLNRPDGQSVEAFRDARVRELEEKILEVGPEKVAAFVAEPILASGGVIVPPEGYQAACLEVCRRHDVLYISDEVVTAFGRLGHFFASEAVFGIEPDIITCAKGLTSGYVPLGAALVHDRVLERMAEDGEKDAVFSSGFTYSGHPVACAAALKNIEIIEREGLLEHVREIGPHFQARLRELEDLPIVREVRGMGLMACVECSVSGDGRDREDVNITIGSRIDEHCQKLGLLVRPLYQMSVMSPPLPITEPQIDEMTGILRRGIERATEDLRREGFMDG
ncbi:MAG TPA: aminotransferase [Thermohalobaculum sp.]|nr:aminotransferase [Thermohalobaculum sp.]